ncbi:MAG: hypothetical protein Q8S00_01855 [Deltaproteobacteria bacterium]|nr:hypothetical protein [Deltaproteobacteria bacterium]
MKKQRRPKSVTAFLRELETREKRHQKRLARIQKSAGENLLKELDKVWAIFRPPPRRAKKAIAKPPKARARDRKRERD